MTSSPCCTGSAVFLVYVRHLIGFSLRGDWWGSSVQSFFDGWDCTKKKDKTKGRHDTLLGCESFLTYYILTVGKEKLWLSCNNSAFLWPDDRHRVKLHPLLGDPNSDYINANYIDVSLIRILPLPLPRGAAAHYSLTHSFKPATRLAHFHLEASIQSDDAAHWCLARCRVVHCCAERLTQTESPLSHLLKPSRINALQIGWTLFSQPSPKPCKMLQIPWNWKKWTSLMLFTLPHLP